MFPYAPKVYRDYLTGHPRLPGDVHVSGDVPKDRPVRLVTIRTAPAGSAPKPRLLAWRRLIFQCYDADEIAAGQLCELVRDIIVRSVYDRIGVNKIIVVGEPARLDDPDDSSPRFQVTIDALFRAGQ